MQNTIEEIVVQRTGLKTVGWPRRILFTWLTIIFVTILPCTHRTKVFHKDTSVDYISLEAKGKFCSQISASNNYAGRIVGCIRADTTAPADL